MALFRIAGQSVSLPAAYLLLNGGLAGQSATPA